MRESAAGAIKIINIVALLLVPLLQERRSRDREPSGKNGPAMRGAFLYRPGDMPAAQAGSSYY